MIVMTDKNRIRGRVVIKSGKAGKKIRFSWEQIYTRSEAYEKCNYICLVLNAIMELEGKPFVELWLRHQYFRSQVKALNEWAKDLGEQVYWF